MRKTAIAQDIMIPLSNTTKELIRRFEQYERLNDNEYNMGYTEPNQ